jgi:hypothetical protein
VCRNTEERRYLMHNQSINQLINQTINHSINHSFYSSVLVFPLIIPLLSYIFLFHISYSKPLLEVVCFYWKFWLSRCLSGMWIFLPHRVNLNFWSLVYKDCQFFIKCLSNVLVYGMISNIFKNKQFPGARSKENNGFFFLLFITFWNHIDLRKLKRKSKS